MKIRQRAMGVAVLILVVWGLLPGMDARAEGKSVRVLEVTRGEYGSSAEDLSPGPQNDGKNFGRVIQEAYGDACEKIVTKDQAGVTTVKGVQQMIRDTFAGAEEGDINYFYYSGHGSSKGLYLGGSQVMTAQALAEGFEGIKGTNILVIDCCYSGKLAVRSVEAVSGAADFAESFTEDFGRAAEDMQTGGMQARSSLTNSRFRLLMAASEEELSWQMGFTDESSGSAQEVSLGRFTMTLCYGCGIDPVKVGTEKDYGLGVVSADYDMDGEVSLSEIRRYVENTYHYAANHVRSYPAEDGGCFLPVGDEKKPALTFGSAYINEEEQAVDVCYSSKKSAAVDYAVYRGDSESLGALSYDGIYYDEEFPVLIGLEKVAEVHGYDRIAADSAEEYVIRIPKDPGWMDGKYYVLVQTKGQKLRYLVPFTLASEENAELKKQFRILLSGDCYTERTEGDPGRFEPVDGGELTVRADFGTGMDDEVETPYLSCYVYDADAHLVRTLGIRALMQAIPEYENNGSKIKTVHYYRNFYWDGKDAEGNPVPIDTYFVRVIASGAVSAEQSVRVIVRRPVDQAEIRYLTVSGQVISIPLAEGAESPRISFLTNEDGQVTLKLRREEAEEGDEILLGTYEAAGGQRLAVTWDGMADGAAGAPGRYVAEAELLPDDPAHERVRKVSEPFTVISSELIPVKEEIPEEGCELGFSEGMEKEAEKEVLPESVSLRAGEKAARKITMGLKEKVQLSAVLIPSDASARGLVFRSSNPGTVSVSSKGKVTAKKKGRAVITLTAKNGKKASVTVTVKKAPDRLAFPAKKKTLRKGKSCKIRVKLPAGTASYQLAFTSSRKKVASIDKNGRIRALKRGRTVITVRSFNGKKARMTVTVK